MDKVRLLEIHENYIRNTYDDLRTLDEEINEYKSKLSDIYNGIIPFNIEEFVNILIELYITSIEYDDDIVRLNISKYQVFRDLGLLDREEANDIICELSLGLSKPYDVEYHVQQFKLLGIDSNSEEYNNTLKLMSHLKEKSRC